MTKFYWQGFRAATPLMVGVAPFGVVFGALAVTSGLTVAETLGMSILVLAGASQFVAASLIADGAPILIIILTTFIINLRHFLYSASITNFLRPVHRGWKILLGYMMVDEVYATSMVHKQKTDPTPIEFVVYFAGAGSNLVVVWWATSVVGALVGDVLPADVTDVLGFTLPLVFTSIVVPLLVTRPAFFAAVSAAAAGIIFAPLPNNLGLLVAAATGIAVGVLAEEPPTTVLEPEMPHEP